MKTRLIFILILTISVIHFIKSENIELISNGNFENKLKDWYTTSGYDKEVDFTKPDIVYKTPTPILLNGERSKDKSSILFNKPHGPYDKRPGLVQAIFLKESDQKNEKKNILISFSYLISEMNPRDIKGKIVMYINIKYTDGTILPIWFYPIEKEYKKMKDWKRSCLLVPYLKKIENIVISFGIFDFKEKFEIYLDSFSIKLISNNLKKETKYCTSQRYLERTTQDFFLKSNYFQSEIQPKKNELTIVTQLSVDRLEYLLKTTNIYNGPISASIYIQNFEEFKKLQKFWIENKSFRRFTTIHLVFNLNYKQLDNPRSGEKYVPYSYPVNYLRNIARKYSKTDYVLYIDCDFIVPSNLYDEIADGKLNDILKKLNSKRKVVLILPGYLTKDKNIYPKDRNDLLNLKKNKIVERIPYNSQFYVDFNRWEKNNNEEFYKVNWHTMLHFEPYFIGPSSMPLFSERFVGCGRDKLQQTLTTHISGFEFYVWKKFFICHLPHPKGTTKLCPYWPPQEYNYHALGSHYFMMFKEFYESNKLDFSSKILKNTIMKNPNQVHNEWLDKIENKKDGHDKRRHHHKVKNFIKPKKNDLFHEFNDNRDLKN
eukprot:gene1576-12701_t